MKTKVGPDTCDRRNLESGTGSPDPHRAARSSRPSRANQIETRSRDDPVRLNPNRDTMRETNARMNDRARHPIRRIYRPDQHFGHAKNAVCDFLVPGRIDCHSTATRSTNASHAGIIGIIGIIGNVGVPQASRRAVLRPRHHGQRRGTNLPRASVHVRPRYPGEARSVSSRASSRSKGYGCGVKDCDGRCPHRPR